MNLELRSSGCRKLVTYLANYGEVSEDEKRGFLDDLFLDPDFRSWIQAYSWIPSVEDLVYLTLLDLDNEHAFTEYEGFRKKILDGFLLANEIGYNEMLRKLEAVTSQDSSDLGKVVSEFLPEGTPLSVDVVFTVDGFNTGMMRDNLVYYSILRVDPETYDSSKLAHEVHHVGAYYWFTQDLKWSKWFGMEGTPERITAELLRYVVSEGVANQLLSPWAVTQIDRSDDVAMLHNNKIKHLDSSYLRYLQMMEDIVLLAFSGDQDRSRDLFRELSIDNTSSGIPAGHYASSRMLREILGEYDESIIIEIFKNPWSFFEIYSKLTCKSIYFSDEFLSLF